MSESFLERMSRFTPNAGKLDRDALLFAAGRGSARPNRMWKSLAAVLAGTQVLSLVLLWPHEAPPVGGMPLQVATVPAADGRVPSAAEEFVSPGVWSARHSLLESEQEDRPAVGETFIDDGPPLRAFAPPPASILN
jgi:hypothetical protein